ncbi:MAG: glutamate--tRNA ligase [Caldisericia bacterium]|nr:glutamate--tRNA ligase [Caldisericia bacterium]
MEKIRVRFAPSPTGLLHIGSVRTAFINYLFAKKENGTYILRIEDTDVERSKKESVEAILSGLKWLKINWDEGPYFQSERLEIYKNYLGVLLNKGYAYPCFCKKEEIEKEKENAIKNGKIYKYSGKCKNLDKKEVYRKLSLNEEHVYRFNVTKGKVIFNDLIKERVEFDNEILDDFIIVRSDGMPVYNFSCVVDDIEMKITHVIRGEDHLSNTHKQILLYDAFGVKHPKFGHLPLILGKDREKLSKRHGSVSIEEFMKEGYLPEAILNYIFLIGFSLRETKEIFNIDEMINIFSIEKISKNSPVFDHDKLKWINSYYIRNLDDETILTLSDKFLPPQLKLKGVHFLKKLFKEIKGNIKVLNIENLTEYFYKEPLYDKDIISDLKKSKIFIDFLKILYKRIIEIEKFDSINIEKEIKMILIELNITLKEIAQPLRYILTGRFASPGLFILMELLGKEIVLKRIENLIC